MERIVRAACVFCEPTPYRFDSNSSARHVAYGPGSPYPKKKAPRDSSVMLIIHFEVVPNDSGHRR